MYQKNSSSSVNLDRLQYVLKNHKEKTFVEMRLDMGCSSRVLRGILRSHDIIPLTAEQVSIIRGVVERARAEERERVIPPVRNSPALSAVDFLPPEKGECAPKKRSKYVRLNESPVVPDPPKPALVRPPAVYTNTSPYGIAADYLLNPHKYEKPDNDEECDANMITYGRGIMSKKTFSGKMNIN